jgi:RNA recognition motif-containing protein
MRNEEMKKIYVGNLARETTEEGLETAFAAFGPIRSAVVIRDRETGSSRGFGFIEMENDEDANAAIAALDQKELDGRVVTVNEARPRTGGPRRGGGRGDSRPRGRDW